MSANLSPRRLVHRPENKGLDGQENDGEANVQRIERKEKHTKRVKKKQKTVAKADAIFRKMAARSRERGFTAVKIGMWTR